MERSVGMDDSREPADFNDAHELECQLEWAERRYAEARASRLKAHEEWRAKSAQPEASAATIRMAKVLHDAIAARCTRLRALIERLERRLDG